MDRQFLGPTAACVQAVAIVWNALTELGFAGGKSKPLVGTFTGPIDGQVVSVYRPEVATIYVRSDCADCLTEQLIYEVVEQVIWHVSGEAGYSRNFQAVQTQVIARLIRFLPFESRAARIGSDLQPWEERPRREV